MSKLSIEDICKDLGVCSMTVRRWIIKGRLIAKKENDRIGYTIDISDYKNFLETNPKYRHVHEGEKDIDWNTLIEKMYALRNSFDSEAHGKIYSDGWNDAMNSMDRLVKECLVMKLAG